jgi:hypothetical protein
MIHSSSIKANLSQAAAKAKLDKAEKSDKPDNADASHHNTAGSKGANSDTRDQALRRQLKDRPEQREAVYKHLASTEPALINHLEKWRQEDEAGEQPTQPKNDNFKTKVIEQYRTREAIREAFGEPQHSPQDWFENRLTPLPNGQPKERFDNRLTPPEGELAQSKATLPILREVKAVAADLLDRAGLRDFVNRNADRLFGATVLSDKAPVSGGQPTGTPGHDIEVNKRKLDDIESQIDELNRTPNKSVSEWFELTKLNVRALDARADLRTSVEAELKEAATAGPAYPGDPRSADQRVAAKAAEIKALAPDDAAFAQLVDNAQTKVNNDRVTEASAAEVERIYDEYGAEAAADALENLQAAHPELADDIAQAAQSTVDAIEQHEQAKARVNEVLSQEDVSEDEIKEVANLLQDMHPEDLNTFMSQMSDGQLAKMASEMNSNGHPFNGFDDGVGSNERIDMIDVFAQGLDAQQLNRVMDHWSSYKNPFFADAIAAHASDSTKAELVGLLKSNSEENGLLIAKVIGSMSDPELVTAALNGLDETQLQHVISAASQIKTEFVKEGGTSIIDPEKTTEVTTADPAPLVDLLDAAARSNDPAMKARVFEAGARQLDAIGGHGPTEEVRQQLTEILESDPSGVIDHLETNDRTGEAISVYVKFMLDAGDTQPLFNIGKELMGGDLTSQEAVIAFLEQTKEVGDGRAPVYQNAQSLGYFLGAIESGAHLWGASAQETADVLGFLADYFPFAQTAIGNIGKQIAEGRLEEGKLIIDKLFPGFDSVIETDLYAAYLFVSERDS